RLKTGRVSLDVTPFQGYLYYSSPQGVALGWYVLALSGQTEYLLPIGEIVLNIKRMNR
nr:hypothetical protein [Desulfobulbaceae bacterium]